MESTTDTSRRPSRPGFWQYPDASPGLDDEHAAAPQAVPGQAGGARRAAREERLGVVLAWIGIGLGAASLVAPRFMARAAGMPPWPNVLRAVGLRELVCGAGLLRRPGDQLWRWSRVAGDTMARSIVSPATMDLAIVGLAAAHPYADRRRLVSTALALATVGALDVRAGNPPRWSPSRLAPEEQGGQHLRHSVSINRPPGDCYRFWRDLARLPTFMRHLESVKVIDERRSHWRARGPAGSRIAWDAEITDDRPGELLGWRSAPGADVDNAGVVRFIPANGGRATIVQVQMRYQPPAGRAGAIAARLFAEEPAIQMRDDLRRFKQLIETGEIPTTRGQPAGARSLVSSLFRKGADR